MEVLQKSQEEFSEESLQEFWQGSCRNSWRNFRGIPGEFSKKPWNNFCIPPTVVCGKFPQEPLKKFQQESLEEFPHGIIGGIFTGFPTRGSSPGGILTIILPGMPEESLVEF